VSRLISIAAGVCPETDPASFVSAAAAAGWPACGVWFDPETWSDVVAAEVRRRLDDTGVVALDMEPIFVLPDGNGGITDVGDRLIDAAAAVGARNVLVVNRGAGDEQFVERFAELCDRAAPAGITCALEFLAFMTVRSLSGAVAVVDAVARPNAGVLVDGLHLARTGSTPADVAALPSSILPYVQICDGPAEMGPDPLADALDLRSIPGEGGLPVRELIAVLDPATPLSLEVRSARLRTDFPDPTDRARHLLDGTRRFLETSTT
jgi:sugar phosphate isomerase/epimerase